MNIFSVSQFVEFVNTALAAAVFPEGVAVEGEVAEYRLSQGKWIWFNLKDEHGTISCFATAWQLRTPLEDGMQVRVFGLPRIYPKSGRFSINVERVELVGEGALRRAFELLKRKLSDEGLFAAGRKRPLPRFPRRIGLIASGESAAYGDFLRILGNRWGGLVIELADVAVQGREAPRQIVSAFRCFNAAPDPVDVIVLTRGGGSLEDLQAFNSEDVARAVFGSRIPVIVGVGHERDETLADFAADVRASTPTNAAEMVVPDRQDVAAVLGGHVRTVGSVIDAALVSRQTAVDRWADRIYNGVRRISSHFDDRCRELHHHFGMFSARAVALGDSVAGFGRRLYSAFGHLSGHWQAELAAQERLLVGLDPRRLLSRGYALVRSGGRIVRDAATVDRGDLLQVQLGRGGLTAEVLDKTGADITY